MAVNLNFRRKDWQTGEVIKEQFLDNIEAGIEEAHTAIKKIDSDFDNIASEFDKAVANVTNGNENVTNSEIVQARGKEVNLNARLTKFDSQFDNIDIKVKEVDKRVEAIEENGVGGGNANIDDNTISKTSTWSSEKIENFVHTNDDVVWSTVQGENLSVDYTKEGYLREVEIWGNTIQNEEDLLNIQHLGELYVNEEGQPILDSEGKEQYKIEVESYNQKTLLSKIKTSVGFAYGGSITKITELTGRFSLSVTNQDVKIHFPNSAELLGRDKWCYVVVKFDKDISDIKFKSLETRGYTIMQDNRTLVFNGFTYGGGVIDGIVINGSSGVILNERYNYEIIEFIATDKKSDFSLWDKYKTHKTTLLLPCQLMKVGDMADRLYWDSEKEKYVVEKNILKEIFNDATDFRYVSEKTNTVRFNTRILITNPKKGGTVICNLLPSQEVYDTDYEGIDFHSNSRGEAHLNINKNKLSEPTVVGLNNYLVDNNMIIYYVTTSPQLIETNITEQISLPCYKDKTHIFVTGGIDGSIKAKVPLDGGQAIQSLSARNVALSLENEEIKEINATQDELIDISLCATDEMFMLLEPLLSEAVNLNERSVSKMVDLYVAMVMRGLKTIEQVPDRYREQVKELLSKLDK